MDINATGTVNILEAIRRHTQRTRFFYAGNCLVFGRVTYSPQTEETCFRPECVYGISKAVGSQAVRLYRNVYGLFAVGGVLYNHESYLRSEKFFFASYRRGSVAYKARPSGSPYPGEPFCQGRLGVRAGLRGSILENSPGAAP